MLVNREAQVLVLESSAQDYVNCLHELIDEGVKIEAATSVHEAEKLPGTFPVVLGQPDLVRGWLRPERPVDWVQSTWAGVKPLLGPGRRDYILTGVKGVFGPQITEYVMGYLLARELKVFERLGHQSKTEWRSEPGGSLQGKTLAVLGTGSIGQHLAGAAVRFGLNVIGLNRGGEVAPGFHRVCSTADLEAFLGEADYLVCTLPETPETDNLLNEAAFRAVKPGCYFVNVGRGGVIDEAALLEALADGRLGGAVLDVFREEPLPADHPFWHAPNVLVTAHVAAKSRPADIARLFLKNYRRYTSGKTLLHRIDFSRGY